MEKVKKKGEIGNKIKRKKRKRRIGFEKQDNDEENIMNKRKKTGRRRDERGRKKKNNCEEEEEVTKNLEGEVHASGDRKSKNGKDKGKVKKKSYKTERIRGK